jgi:hypothetical protein
MAVEFTEIKYVKTVEGKFDVTLIHNNVVLTTINFEYEELAREYVDIKQQLKSHAAALIAEVTANLLKAEAQAVPTIKATTTEIKTTIEKTEAAVESKIETFVANVKNKVEKAKGIDVSAKVSGDENKVIDTSAKAAKSSDEGWQESAKVKIAASE